MFDPYPTMNLEYALKALRIRFGKENVKFAPASRQITVPVQYPGVAEPIQVMLTVEQAKYLAVNPWDSKSIVEGRLPFGLPK